MFRDSCWEPDRTEGRGARVLALRHRRRDQRPPHRRRGAPSGAALRRVPGGGGERRAPRGPRGLSKLRTEVLQVLQGTDCCTHLNDALRSLAEVPILGARLDARPAEGSSHHPAGSERSDGVGVVAELGEDVVGVLARQHAGLGHRLAAREANERRQSRTCSPKVGCSTSTSMPSAPAKAVGLEHRLRRRPRGAPPRTRRRRQERGPPSAGRAWWRTRRPAPRRALGVIAARDRVGEARVAAEVDLVGQGGDSDGHSPGPAQRGRPTRRQAS